MATHSAERLRVLVVEDEALIAENLRLTLEDLGYEALPACYTYQEAQQWLSTLAPSSPAWPDIVLLDVNLGHPDPALTGLSLARQLRAMQGPPFVFLTAYSDLDIIRQATGLRPGGYLIKPVSGPTLFAALQTVLAQAQTPAAPLAAAETPAFFFVRLGGQLQRLLWQEVASLEAGKNYVTLRLHGLPTSYSLRGSLTYVHQQLVPAALRATFVRVSRTLAVNRRFVTAFDARYVYVAGVGHELTSGGYHELLAGSAVV